VENIKLVNIVKTVKLVFSVLLFAAAIYLGQQIISHSIANQRSKVDYAEINHIKYGLFSVNEWKKQVSFIITEEINGMSLTRSNEKALKAQVEVQLNLLIDKVDQKVRKTNAKSTSGRIKQSLINTFVDMKDIKEGIPEYADAILLEMKRANTESKLKGVVKKKITNYLEKTFEDQDTSRMTEILIRTATVDAQSARIKLDQDIASTTHHIYDLTWILILVSVVLFLLPAFDKGPLPAPQYMLMLGSLLVLLAAGVTTPMIDMEAKISELSFMLMDYPIRFLNQVLYFQTKSILDVFWVMILHKDLQMKVVGILMVSFSIFFPLIKMISSVAYYYDFKRATKNKLIQFFVLKSGKWSMTDVLIVAIFMAYIGFNGIISSQFGNFNTETQDVVILTTNGTSLQPGFYLFLTYTILALFLSVFLTRKPAVKVSASTMA
jgi:hypothetical protein